MHHTNEPHIRHKTEIMGLPIYFNVKPRTQNFPFRQGTGSGSEVHTQSPLGARLSTDNGISIHAIKVRFLSLVMIGSNVVFVRLSNILFTPIYFLAVYTCHTCVSSFIYCSRHDPSFRSIGI